MQIQINNMIIKLKIQKKIIKKWNKKIENKKIKK